MKGLRERLLEKAASNLLAEADPALVRDYYESVLDSVGSVVYTVNRDLRVTGVNQQWDNFALSNDGEHLTSEHILGARLLDQMNGAALERWRTVCRQILDDQLSYYVDEIAAKEPCVWRHYSLAAHPLRDSQGEIMGITFVATNITQLKKAEHEMFKRLVEIRGLRQVAHVAGAWVDRRKVYKQITSDVAHLFGADKCVVFLWDKQSGHLQAKEPAFGLVGRRLAGLSLDMGHPADPDSLWTDLEERDYILLNEGDDAPSNMMETSARVDQLAAMMAILRVSGRIHGAVLVAGRECSFSDQDGRLLAMFAAPLALSIENNELNRRLLDRTQQMVGTQDELDQMVRINEAIRMPLSVIRGYLELLLDGVLGAVPEGQKATMHTVLDKTQAIANLVNRVSPQRFPHDAACYEPVHLGDLIRRVLDRRLSSIERAGLDLSTQLPASHDEESMTAGDPDLLFQVFDALLDNAIKFSLHGGTICVSLHLSNDIVYVKVADSGIGIPARHLLGIWNSRERATRSGSTSLAEIKRIVEGYGGQVWVESTLGQGSTFYVALRSGALTA